MPELPEVETTRRGVAPHVVGRHVAELHVYDRRLRWPVPANLRSRLRGRTIEAVERRSKYLLFRMGANTLLMHFGMTGSLRVYRSLPPRRLHDHVDLVLDDGTTLRYHDPRRFGAMLWVRGSGATHPLLRDLGPEPFDPAFDARYLWQETRGRRAAIKLLLMDNRLVVGVGNIYANESLFRAGIRPSVPAGNALRVSRSSRRSNRRRWSASAARPNSVARKRASCRNVVLPRSASISKNTCRVSSRLRIRARTAR